jgi:hypothetical protein
LCRYKAVTLVARAQSFQSPTSPQQVTNATFDNAYAVMDTARSKYDSRIQQRIYMVFDWRQGRD